MHSSDINPADTAENWDRISKPVNAYKRSKHNKTDSEQEDTQLLSFNKRQLVQAMDNLLVDSLFTNCANIHLLASFVIFMCKEGVIKKRHPAMGTISKYVEDFGLALLKNADGKNILTMQPHELESLFQKIIYREGVANTRDVKIHLEYFYEVFLKQQHLVPTPVADINWEDVLQEDLMSSQYIDAALISRHEYLAAFHDLLNDPRLRMNRRQRRANAMLLLILYHYGVRPGEAAGLGFKDVKNYRDGQIRIAIRYNRYLHLKSVNGARKLFLFEPLTDEERDLFDEWYAHIEAIADHFSHLETAFFCQPGLPMLRMNFNEALRYVLEALERAVGDKVRLRHLRHTYASRLAMAVCLDDIPSGLCGDIYYSLNGNLDPASVRQLLTGTERITQRGLYAVASCMGHGSPATTLKYYIHTLEFLAHDWQVSHFTKLMHEAFPEENYEFPKAA